ncbi:hypothetical protein FRC17_005894 [Serendipita sp. 399]|nr:hypothetical protein FRC17_005894 [Serendipita sp. 399]
MGGYDDLTPEKCQVLCENVGFSLAGVEFARECFCGNTITGNNRPSSGGTCSMRCTGDSNKTCGGPDAINIYVKDNFQYTVGPAAVLDSYNGYSKTQCWQDSANNRILKQKQVIPEGSMSVQKCIDRCAAAGFSSAGVEFGKECFCDNITYPPSQSQDMSECNKPCTGDGSQICGGANRILIYHGPDAAPLTTYRGIIEVLTADTNGRLGYVARTSSTNNIGGFSNEANAQIITFQAPVGATSVSLRELTRENPADGFPFLGLVQGNLNADSDLEPGSLDYVYVSGTPHSPVGATPQTGNNAFTAKSGIPRTWESSTWNIDLATGALTPQWVNTNGAIPDLTILLNPTYQLFFVCGDPAEFKKLYTDANDITVKFKFVPRP